MDDILNTFMRRWHEGMYGKPEDILRLIDWRPGLKPDLDWSDKKISPRKPFLTAADLIMLREMRIKL